ALWLRADVERLRTNEAIVPTLLHDVRYPAEGTRGSEGGREQLLGNTARKGHHALVELHVRVQWPPLRSRLLWEGRGNRAQRRGNGVMPRTGRGGGRRGLHARRAR